MRSGGGAVHHHHHHQSLLTRKVSPWDVGGAKSGDVALEMGERGCARRRAGCRARLLRALPGPSSAAVAGRWRGSGLVMGGALPP